MKTVYAHGVLKALNGQIEQAAACGASLRNAWSAIEEQLQQRLISTRLAIKAGNLEIDIQVLEPRATEDLYLRAEIHFVRALYFMNRDREDLAGAEFVLAASYYKKCDLQERSLLAEFNASLAHVSQSPELSVAEQLRCFRQILEKAQEISCRNVVALCHRQQSYILYAAQRYWSALREVQVALEIFADHGPQSDYHLSLLHAADCAWYAKQKEEAYILAESVPFAVEARVQFPLAYVRYLLFEEPLVLHRFDRVHPLWRKRYDYVCSQRVVENAPVLLWFWSQQTHELQDEHGQAVAIVRPQSLEGRLLKQLDYQACTRILLCEILWPESVDHTTLDERFYRLVSRLNKKTRGLIEFDGRAYKLRFKIKF